MKNHLKQIPYFVILLPVFFVFHGFKENFGFISGIDAAELAFIYCAFTICVFVFSFIFFRNYRKAALMTAAWIGFYLFFGAIFDFLKTYSPLRIFWRYGFLAFLFGSFFIWLFYYLWKTKTKLFQVTLFFNLLFIIYIIIDIVQVAWLTLYPYQNKLSIYSFEKDKGMVMPDTIEKPDIYFLVFDEYSSSKSLKERYNFDNDIDSFLRLNDFSVQANSFSNYNYTPFSIASILNMQYLNWVDGQKGVNRKDFLHCNPAIRENEVMKFLGLNGYEIVNLSFFDVIGHPSRIKQSFVPVKTKMIAEGTLVPRLYRDFQWAFYRYKILSNLLDEEMIWKQIGTNELFLTEVVNQSLKKQDQPRIIYAHIFLPHPPIFYDENGKKIENLMLMADVYNEPPTAYLNYVKYTNTRMKELVNTIKENTDSKAAIILLSDHGFRSNTTHPHPKWHFQNLNAVYLPDKNYEGFYDSISNVNEFRVIFNNLFRQDLPLLKDSTIFLKDRK